MALPAAPFRSVARTGWPDIPDRIRLTNGELPLAVVHNPRARRLSLRLSAATRAARLTVPPRTSTARVLAFLDQQRDWLARQAALRLPPPLPFTPGVLLPVAGEELCLVPADGHLARRQGRQLLVPGTGELFAGRVRRWLRAEALRLLQTETLHLAACAGRPVRMVRVGDFRSRWGSCSPDGRIAYSWRLLLAPPFVRRAVVAHEVAHLLEMNHGPRFWSHATRLLGQPHDEARRWLRRHGPQLLCYGVSG